MADGTQFGVDLITFYHPAFWGVDDYEDIITLCEKDPLAFWDRILDGLTEAGISLLEITFPPADWNSVLTAYGSAAAFRHELEGRGLSLKSGFYLGLDWEPGTDRAKASDAAARYAEFIREAGGDTLVLGPPMRRDRTATPVFFVDLEYMTAIADLLHHVGRATMASGVRTAVHTEAHSIFCTRRDVDLLMALTDPTYVFMCPDTGHLVLSGADPTEVVTRHHERMIICHWKDAIGPMPDDAPIDKNIHILHRKYFRRVGAGRINWFEWDRLINKTPISGVTLLELDAVPNPVQELVAAREYIEQTLDKVALS